jgi:hypothetical protein
VINQYLIAHHRIEITDSGKKENNNKNSSNHLVLGNNKNLFIRLTPNTLPLANNNNKK